MKNVLVIGDGGREHAIIHALERSEQLGNVYGIYSNDAFLKTSPKLEITHERHDIPGWCVNNKIDYVIVGPETFLEYDFVEKIRQEGIPVIGPNIQGAQLEYSKIHSKYFMERHSIPTAPFIAYPWNAHTNTEFQTAAEHFAYNEKIVLKYDGLAGGKGAFVCKEKADITNAYSELENVIGELGGKSFLLEDFIEGQEISFFCAVHDNQFIPLATAQDYKPLYEGGPNTGGMGAISPSPLIINDISKNSINVELYNKIINQIVKPTFEGFANDGIVYSGFLFFGIIVDENEDPYLLEYNTRLGDPEAQTILPRLDSDFIDICDWIANGGQKPAVKWKLENAVCSVAVTENYPYNADSIPTPEDLCSILSTTSNYLYYGKSYSGFSSGRVLSVTSLGNSYTAARLKTYEDMLRLTTAHKLKYRTDIGADID